MPFWKRDAESAEWLANVDFFEGFDHEHLVYRHQGRDFRLTDVSGRVVKELIV